MWQQDFLIVLISPIFFYILCLFNTLGNHGPPKHHISCIFFGKVCLFAKPHNFYFSVHLYKLTGKGHLAEICYPLHDLFMEFSESFCSRKFLWRSVVSLSWRKLFSIHSHINQHHDLLSGILYPRLKSLI